MKINWKTCFKIGAAVFVLYLCIYYWPSFTSFFSTILAAAFPLFIGCIIAYPINILMSFYERHFFPKAKNKIICKSRRVICMLGAIVTLLAVIGLVIVLIVPQLVSCVQLIFAELPVVIEELLVRAKKFDVLPEDILNSLSSIDWKSRIGQIVELLTSGVGSVMDTAFKVVSSVFSGTVTALLSIIFAIYLLISKDRLHRQFTGVMKHYLRDSWYRKISYVVSVFDDCFRRFIVGQCTEAVILGILCTLGMLVFQLPYATMIGALIAFTALIPIAGAYVGAGIGAFMILTVSPVKAIIFIVFIVILQQLEGNLIYPKVVGSSIGLPGIWVLAAITVGGGIMGITGMLISVPITAAVYRIIRDDMHNSNSAHTVNPG